MATRTVRQSGGDYSTLSAALAAAGAGDVISIEGTWTVNDTSAATISDDNITIQTDADSRHNGYYNASDGHYRLVVSGANALTLAGSYTATIDGLAIIQAGTGVSDEAFRCVPLPGDTVTVKNCLIACAFNALQQDGIYTGFNISIGTLTVENCVIYACGRGGIHSQNGATATHSGTINVNSCTLWLNGRYGSNPNAGSVGGGIRTFVDSGGNASGFTMNVHNTIAVENDTGNTNGNVPQDYADHVQFGTGPVWNVSYSIDSDNTISTAANSGTGNLASRTATENTSPGAGDWVIFGDVSSAIDLRLIDNAENDAQDMHATATAHGLTILSTDITGTSRPQNTNYDVGAYEIAAGGGTTYEDSTDLDVDAAVALINNLTYFNAITAAADASISVVDEILLSNGVSLGTDAGISIRTTPIDAALLQEDSSYILLENGNFLLLEGIDGTLYDESISLGADLSIAITNIAVLLNTITLIQNMDVTLLSQLAAGENISLSSDMAIALANNLALNDVVVLTNTADINNVASLQTLDSMSLGVDASITQSSLMNILTSILLASSADYNSTENLSTLDEISLSAEADYNNINIASFQDIINLAIEADNNYTVMLVTDQVLNLLADAGVTINDNINVQDSINLSAEADIAQGGGLLSEDGITLSVIGTVASQADYSIGLSIVLATNVDIEQVGNLIAQAAATLDITAGSDTTASVQIDQNVALNAELDTSSGGGLLSEDAISLTSEVDINAAVTYMAMPSVGLAAELASAFANTLSIEDELSLNVEADMQLIANLIANEVLSIAADFSFDAITGTLFSETLGLDAVSAIQNSVQSIISENLNIGTNLNVAVNSNIIGNNQVVMSVTATAQMVGEGGESQAPAVIIYSSDINIFISGTGDAKISLVASSDLDL